jgi:hypothetical protein
MSETNTHRYFIPPSLFRIGTPHHFLPVCVTYWRGERIVEKIVARINKKNIISYLKKTRPSQRLFSLLRVTCTQFTSPLIRLDFFKIFLFFFCETETSKDQRQKEENKKKKKGVTAVKQQQLTTLAHTLQPIGYIYKEPLAPAHPNQIISFFLSQKSHDHGRLVTRGEN